MVAPAQVKVDTAAEGIDQGVGRRTVRQVDVAVRAAQMLIAVTARFLMLFERLPPTRRGGVLTLGNPRRMHGRAPHPGPG